MDQAEATEREAIENAANGECTDGGAAIENANQTFADFRRADRARDDRTAYGELPAGIATSRKSSM